MDTLLKWNIAWGILLPTSTALIFFTTLFKWAALFYALGGIMFLIGFLCWMVWGMAKGGL